MSLVISEAMIHFPAVHAAVSIDASVAIQPGGDAAALDYVHSWLIAYQADLAAAYRDTLSQTLFVNRYELRPTMLRRIANEEATIFVNTFSAFVEPAAIERGRQLARAGLAESSVLRISHATRVFLLRNLAADAFLCALEHVEQYHVAVMRGFLEHRTSTTLEEQERIRSAIQRTLSRYALQMAVAADVARAATSILDLDELLQTTTELIRNRFDLYYVGIFLTDEDDRWAILQTHSGVPGQVMLRRGYRLKVGGDSLVGQCIACGEARIALDVGERAVIFNTPLITDIHSEMAVPLGSRGKIIGAMAIQSRRVAAFSEQDVSVMRIAADQLANAIENARLYQQLRHELAERERTTEELRNAKDAAEAASRSKSTFLATMSHELRTPLTAIIGYSELLQKEAHYLGYSPSMHDDLDRIGNAGKHLLALINDILDLSKIEAGKMSLYLEPIDVLPLVHGVVTTIHPLIEQNANVLHVTYTGSLSTMHADGTKVKQALFNLLSNAAKFTEHGTIALDVSCEHIDERDWMLFQISDTGIGITPDQLRLLFKEFTQADASTTRRHGGTGLGLALSQRMCQMMGGDIVATSVFGSGSTFIMRLPVEVEIMVEVDEVEQQSIVVPSD